MNKKSIITIIIIICICLLLPNNVKATEGENILGSNHETNIIESVENNEPEVLTGLTGGGSLLKPISQFLCYIFDAIIDLLQEMFVTPENIKIENDDYSINYSIKYSPAIIFSGQVPALDIDFITPGEGRTGSVTKTEKYSLIDALNMNGAKKVFEKQYDGVGFNYVFVTKKGTIRDIKKDKIYGYDKTREIDIELLEGKIQSLQSEKPEISFAGGTWDSEANSFECVWYNEDETKLYIIVDYFKIKQQMDTSGLYSNVNEGIIYLYELDINEDLGEVTDITGEEFKEIIYTKHYASSAAILQNVISTWYNALRRIALVGLLSALIYIGIRILLTSTSAKDKAKYKKMLKDWFVALCLLFALHYVMSFTITIVDKISEVFRVSTIAANGEDILMTNVRNTILNGNNWSEVLAYVVIYSVLVVFTIIYTIQYLRRIIYLAFLTVIAPLITLTYPLDKIKDNKSQAFDMWIKDYIFFSLIQVVHLLIYYVFLGSAIDLTNSGNWLFAIVAIAFITPAEKLIKKMFGFEKSKTLGAMAAGATGALVVNAMKKFPQGKEKQSTVATAKPIKTSAGQPIGDFAREYMASGGIVNTSSSSTGGGAGNSSNQASKLADLINSTSKMKKPKRRTIKGIGNVARKYFPSVAGGSIRVMAQTTGALIGVSAILAQGEYENIGTGLMVGSGAGKAAANITENAIKGAGKIPEKAKEIMETFNEGAGRNKFNKVFRNYREYEDLKRDSGFGTDEFDKKVQTMVDSGIKNTKQMSKILNNHKKHPRKYSMEKAIKYSQLAEKCTDDILNDKAKFIRFCEDQKLKITDEELIKLRQDIMNFK